MTAFALIAALMCAAACVLVLRPLLWPRGRAAPDAAQISAVRAEDMALRLRAQSGALAATEFEAARAALALRLLDALAAVPAPPGSRTWPAVLAVVAFIPLLSLPLYWKVGTPDAMKPGAEMAGEAESPAAVAELESRVTALEQRLAAAPQDGPGWAVLARSLATLGRYQKAAAAFARADALVKNDAQLLADYADALAMAQGRRLAGEPLKLLERALIADRDNVKALLLFGTAAFEARDFARAIEVWSRVPKLVPQDTELIAALEKSVAEARSNLGAEAAGAAAPAAGGAARGAPPAAVDAAAAVSGRVTLSRELAAKAGPDDIVFIFARAAQGSRMPLAALRRQVRDLPLDFRLDDSMAMAPTMKLSSVPEVVLTARISKSGDPIPRSGDLEATSAPVKLGAAGIKLEIRDVVK